MRARIDTSRIGRLRGERGGGPGGEGGKPGILHMYAGTEFLIVEEGRGRRKRRRTRRRKSDARNMYVTRSIRFNQATSIVP